MNRKQAQESSFYSPEMQGRTLLDLYRAIRADAGLPPVEKQQLISQIQSMTQGAPESTPLSALMYRGLGGVLGYLMSKYFGMGPVGQVVTTLLGVGLGNAFNNQLNKPRAPTGWMEI